jgi:hypothetical protein
MANFKIFAESKADIKFIQDYIAELFKEFLNEEDFDSIGGRTGYKAGGELKATFRKNYDNNKKSILIVDADDNFSQSKNEILADFEKYNIPILLFQFPNNAANGNLEDTLAEIAVDKKLMGCFRDYEKCVNAYPKKLNDSRIYSYLDMLLIDKYKDEKGKDLRKEEFRNYRNVNHWNLHHEFLNPLKEFLNPFFQ